MRSRLLRGDEVAWTPSWQISLAACGSSPGGNTICVETRSVGVNSQMDVKRGVRMRTGMSLGLGVADASESEEFDLIRSEGYGAVSIRNISQKG